ncbi:tRNA (adenosine(37)-N6)-threonylcarbamoyltransferase complex transferase subunit TsaD [Candidatus Giovannonibacteria bacterium]|nr:tRNA (adenosine(37)-N6)-threonylcarbamoyltransferase complex transferase subunit TsaD [Candidatus Giovannonibacteria bacterium]
MRILAIETSCDETAISIIESKEEKKYPEIKVLANVVLSQIKIHKPFGGVVPNLAMREHQKNLPHVLKLALKEGKFSISDFRFPISKQNKINKKLETLLSREPELFKLFKKELLSVPPPDIDAIAVTYGPGLEPALWVGINFAKALSYLWNKPLIPVNHLEGHIYAAWLSDENLRETLSTKDLTPKPPLLTKERGEKREIISLQGVRSEPQFPLLSLIVSGGHTELVLMKKHLDYKILGETLDDAAGEAFDKVAKMLKLGYPGGPEISKAGEKGNSRAVNFPRPMINSKDLNFSFSGLKTSVLYFLKNQNLASEISLAPSRKKSELNSATARPHLEISDASFRLEDIAASFEQAAVDVLVSKTKKALENSKAKTLVVGGGVAANKKLRAALEKLVSEKFPKTSLFLSPMWLTGDNATMIAAAAYFKVLKKKPSKNLDIKAQGNLRLSD